MRSTGTDQPVRARKAGNAAGAKGLGQERVRELLVPVRWPRTLQLVLKGCDGESNAFYEIAVVRCLLRKSWEYQKLHKNHSLALFRNTPPLAAGILYFVARSL